MGPMTEGWFENTYYVLFDEQDVERVSEQYGIGHYLPGFVIVGLRAWDDFIVRDVHGSLFVVPTVPMAERYLDSAATPIVREQLERDPRYAGKIKWWIQPLVFGGNPNDANNSTWVPLEQHAKLVRWWNDKYQQMLVSNGP